LELAAPAGAQTINNTINFGPSAVKPSSILRRIVTFHVLKPPLENLRKSHRDGG